ncbi:MAG: mannose-1-phosphate guanylyltransferase/mannose-6-phosphate isomerase [Rhodocyclaceae bacterium]|nr:mannose-1-phosphate guanylyltransferase/mannose-6-phosphate isomerase [Rhodocyclaceae bacterium]
MKSKIVPVILSGGAGARLWPVSREALPKPFIKLPDGQSLLQKTLHRAASIGGVETVLTVTNKDYYFLTRDEYVEAGVGRLNLGYLLEPAARNTAPAIAAAALHLSRSRGEDTVLLVLPADHLIHDQAGFAAAVGQALDLAGQGWLVVFGVAPTRPETGYGYIEAGETIEGTGGYRVSRFVEKPDSATAQAYLASGCFTWNSGMFCFTAATLLQAMRKHAPAVMSAVETALKESGSAEEMTLLEPKSFAAVPDISLDYAVMERAGNVAVIPAGYDWNDIGSWDALAALTAADERGNRIVGDAVTVDSHDCYIQSDSRIVASVGVSNLLIIDTPDALLVADRARAQDVKAVVQQLKLVSHDSVRHHRLVHRPWGTYTVLEEGERFKLKRIVVKPGASLSLQMHRHRSEHWVVVSGIAQVSNNGETYLVGTNESTYIPAGHKHRLENTGAADLVIIEVQSGDYVGEDDIVRFDDAYGRADDTSTQDRNE